MSLRISAFWWDSHATHCKVTNKDSASGDLVDILTSIKSPTTELSEQHATYPFDCGSNNNPSLLILHWLRETPQWQTRMRLFRFLSSDVNIIIIRMQLSLSRRNGFFESDIPELSEPRIRGVLAILEIDCNSMPPELAITLDPLESHKVSLGSYGAYPSRCF